jgi:hypothetical protein
MLGRQALKGLLAALSFTAGCSEPEDPFTSGPAHATVTGLVTRADGSPVPGTSVGIGCAGGGVTLLASTDTAGRYMANLVTGSNPFDGANGRLLCHFTEPAEAPARAQLDTAVGFARGPVLVALQFIDLQEP